MGSPLSLLLAGIFIVNFEVNYSQILDNKNQFKCKIIYWYYWCNYVDDVLCLIDGWDRQLETFF